MINKQSLNHLLARRLLSFLFIAVIAIGAMWNEAISVVLPHPIVSSPAIYYTVCEKALDYGCKVAWNKAYNIFDVPSCMCLLATGDNENQFFVMDRAQGSLIYLGTTDLSNGDRKLEFIKRFGNHFGSGTFQYDNPTSITISNHETTCIQELFVLDSGNNRIQKLSVSTCGWTISHVSYIYDSTNNHGYGPLNDARSIEYCDLPGAEHDLLLVADSGNHRILILDPADGTVEASIGEGACEQSANKLCYPVDIAATRIDDEDGQAFIYILDRANNKVALIERTESGSYVWRKVYSFPMQVQEPRISFELSAQMGSGLASIALDDSKDTGIKGGIYILDNSSNKLLHLDGLLNGILEEYDQLDSPFIECSASSGQLAILSTYSDETGLRIYDIPSSIISLSASPNPFKKLLEWTMISAPVTNSGDLLAVVKQGSTTIKTLYDGFVYAGEQNLIWDGTNDSGYQVAAGTYTIVCTLEAEFAPYGNPYISTKQTNVMKVDDETIKILATHSSILDPQWSPTGTEIAYSAKDGSNNLNIRKINYYGGVEANITGYASSGKHDLYASWTHSGDSVAYSRRLSSNIGLWGYENALYLKAATGQGLERLISDTTGTPGQRQLFDVNPKWIPNENAISYIKHVGYDASAVDKLNKITLASKYCETIHQFGGWTQHYSWSPYYDAIGMSYHTVGPDLAYKIYTYDIEDNFGTQLTMDTDTFLYDYSAEWSPGYSKILFIEDWFCGGSYRWDIFTISPEGGSKIPVGIHSQDAVMGSAIAWSPDGTKIVFSIANASNCNLVCADFIRNDIDAFPAAKIDLPLANSTIDSIVTITGSAAHNWGVGGAAIELSHLQEYYLEYGHGERPAEWSRSGITLACTSNCDIENGTLATWNTGLLEGGEYTLRLVAKDDKDSNVVYRRFNVLHDKFIVKKDASGDFTTIQAGINACNMGDTVLVYAGNYSENVAMKEGVYLKADEADVNIIGGSGIGVSISNHAAKCTIDGFTIKNSSGYFDGAGMYILNASPDILNCSITNNAASSKNGGGVYIRNNSNPHFYNCTISNNTASNGSGVAIFGFGTAHPAPRFYNCVFSYNVATTNAAIYIQYDSYYESDIVFSDCTISHNDSHDNESAINLTNIKNPKFMRCDINHNRVIYNTYYLAVIRAWTSSPQFDNCTISDNSMTVTTDASVIMTYAMSDPVVIDRSIIAYNNAHMTSSNITMNNSYVYGQLSGDSYWLTHGENNFVANPCFCDKANDAYTLYSYSRCSPELSAIGLIGAYNVGCSPGVSVYPQDSLVRACPKGDWEPLIVHIAFDTTDMQRTIEANELSIDTLNLVHINLQIHDPIIADSAATAANNWHTTITHPYVSIHGQTCGCGMDSVGALLNGGLLGKAGVRVKSPDYTGIIGNGSGKVNLSDLVFFGSTYNKCKSNINYNECFNFTCDALCPADTCVNLSDMVYFSTHYQHFPPWWPTGLKSEQIALSVGAIRLSLADQASSKGDSKEISLALTLDGVQDLRAGVIIISAESMEFIRWNRNADLAVESYATGTTRDGNKEIFIVLFAESPPRGSTIELGTLTVLTATGTLDNAPIVSVEVMNSQGEIASISEVELEDKTPPAPARNYLASNYPNPFNPNTTIEYSIAKDTHVKLGIYNANGQVVRTLVDQFQKKNIYKVIWDGKDNNGNSVASGIYFCGIKTADFEENGKMVLIR